MNARERELLKEWIAHSHLQDLQLAALEAENLRLRQLALDIWSRDFQRFKADVLFDRANLIPSPKFPDVPATV